jgi:hypothetical protein
MAPTIEAPSIEEIAGIIGEVTWELTDKDGNLKRSGKAKNLITQVGDQMYGERGAGITTTPTPTGMKLGTGSTAVAKTGAGAALVTYLTNSHQAFDGTYPQSSLSTGRVITYRVTFAAGKATTASPITEAVIVNEALADATSAAAATVSRVILAGIGSKGASDTLTITWTHTILGA